MSRRIIVIVSRRACLYVGPHVCPHATYIQSLSVVAPWSVHAPSRDAIYLARTTPKPTPRLLTVADVSTLVHQGCSTFWDNDSEARGPAAPSAHEAWLQISQHLLTRIERERVGPNSGGGSGPATTASGSDPFGIEAGKSSASTDGASRQEEALRAAAAKLAKGEAEMLIELALIELRGMPQPQPQPEPQPAEAAPAARMDAPASARQPAAQPPDRGLTPPRPRFLYYR